MFTLLWLLLSSRSFLYELTSFLSAIWINFISYEVTFLKLKLSKLSRQFMVRKLSEYLFHEIVFQIVNIFKIFVFQAASHEMMCPNSWQEPMRDAQTLGRSWASKSWYLKDCMHLPPTFEIEIWNSLWNLLIFCPFISKTSIFISNGLINPTRNTTTFTDAVLFKTSTTLKAYSGGNKRHEISPSIQEKVIIHSYERSAAVLTLSFQ